MNVAIFFFKKKKEKKKETNEINRLEIGRELKRRHFHLKL